MFIKAFSIAALAVSLAMPAMAGDFSNLPAPKKTTLGLYYTPEEAAEVVGKEPAATLFLDVRTPAEVTFVGMPMMVDANVPYVVPPAFPQFDDKAGTFKLEPNSDFAAEVARRLAAKGLTKDSRVILMCRSGDRSAKAANLLATAGYTQVYSIVDGFEGDKAADGAKKGQRVVNGWKNAGLPWSYTLARAKMYQID